MRAILGIAVALAVLWGGYWFAGTRVIRAQLDQWLVQNADVATVQSFGISGFPSRFDITFDGAAVQDTARGISAKLPFLQVFAMTWKPWHVIAAMPPQIEITYQGQDFTLRSDRMLASALSKPARRFDLTELRLDSEVASLNAQNWAISAAHMTAAMDATTGQNAPRIGLRLRDITLPAGPAQKLAMPQMVDTLRLDARLDMPKLGAVLAVDLADLGLVWGQFSVTAKGRLARDDLGFVSGDITLAVQDWPKLPAILAGLGVISGDQIAVLQRGVAVLGTSGEVRLKLADGKIWMGPILLGRAPVWPL
jgi:hypothetical protein